MRSCTAPSPGRRRARSTSSPDALIPDEDGPYGVVRTLVDALPSGSVLVLSQGTADFHTPAPAEEQSSFYVGAARVR